MDKLKKKEIGFTEKLIKQVQEYADKNLEGNFNMAVRNLLNKGLKGE